MASLPVWVCEHCGREVPMNTWHSCFERTTNVGEFQMCDRCGRYAFDDEFCDWLCPDCYAKARERE